MKKQQKMKVSGKLMQTRKTSKSKRRVSPQKNERKGVAPEKMRERVSPQKNERKGVAPEK